jgi:hypothetical protein
LLLLFLCLQRPVVDSGAAAGWLLHIAMLLPLPLPLPPPPPLLLLLLQVMEDVTEGYVVTGLSSRAAKNASELRSDFNSGRANRDTQVRMP